MIQQQKIVAKLLSYLIRRFFIISNSYIKATLKIIQLIVVVDSENLHIIRKKIVTLKRKSPVLPILEGKH